MEGEKKRRSRRRGRGKQKAKGDAYLLSVLLCLGCIALALPLNCLGLKSGSLLLCSIGNHDVSIVLFGRVVCHLTNNGTDVAFEGGGRVCWVSNMCVGPNRVSASCGQGTGVSVVRVHG